MDGSLLVDGDRVLGEEPDGLVRKGMMVPRGAKSKDEIEAEERRSLYSLLLTL
jgi:hypothetical protein